ncbi:Lcl3 protein [Saccharomycopsis crataegensis]|uniref:Probable endonuclease LCL3 n=1 Tax=Saccharomycopsis crataegensis TaxID=43959 RepID=A0AAV5QG18_9ASCO|nr:Lcl3 protein [Saccharomycopsis crataegensis]
MGDNKNTETSSAKDISIFHPKTILLASVLTGGFLASYGWYKRHLVRVPTALDIPTNHFRQKFSVGYVTSVGDGDNFHFFHTPGGVFAGWGWLRHPPTARKQLTKQTWSVRLCGVDAPERAHFGKPSQPFADDSLAWLRQYVLHQKVKVKPLRIDQYNRVVSKVLIKKWGVITKDVGEEMLKNGIAVVYENQAGSEFDGQEAIYRRCEKKAKQQKLGLWGVQHTLTPGQYKRKYR